MEIKTDFNLRLNVYPSKLITNVVMTAWVWEIIIKCTLLKIESICTVSYWTKTVNWGCIMDNVNQIWNTENILSFPINKAVCSINTHLAIWYVL